MSARMDDTFRITGLVVDPRTRRGIAGMRVEAWDKDLLIDDLVGSAETDAEGAFQIQFGGRHFRELFFDRSPDLFFKVFHGTELIVSTENAVLWNARAGDVPVAIPVELPSGGGTGGGHHVEGHAVFAHGLPAERLTLRLFHRGFGDSAVRLGEAVTDDAGAYSLAYRPVARTTNLEARALDTGGEEIALPGTRWDAGPREVLDLVIPTAVRPLAPEYGRIAADVRRELGGELERLADAREDDERQDLTYLHNATGWDARLIAQLALAVRLRRDTGVAAEALYALLRTELPSDPWALARVAPSAVSMALERAQGAGIVAMSAAERAAAREAFERFAQTTRRGDPAPGTLSSFDELLAESGLDEREREAFAALYLEAGLDGEALWNKARERLPVPKVDALRLQGKLAHLTLNNAPLVAVLQREVGSLDRLDRLVELDLHQPEAWKSRLRALAGTPAALDALIPSAFGGTPAERLDAYAADLARRVRLSYPTPVVGRMLQRGELHLGDDASHARLAAPVQTFLQRAVPLGFELGRVPVSAFIAEHRESLFAGLPAPEAETAVEGAKRLQRLYQITPTDGALRVLAAAGFASAADVTAFRRDLFIERYGARFATLEEADLVYRKAQQVSAVTHGVLVAAREMEGAPGLYAVSGADRQTEVASARAELVRRFPTLETLFGSQDYCECDHCRSVLSPAAYLVDLLRFLDPDERKWSASLDNWRRKHGGAPYPFRGAAEWTAYQDEWRRAHPGEGDPVHTPLRPFDVQDGRRPDLAHLPLTCENTHTTLPHIDVVNEVLEYFVVHGRLSGEAARDTGDAPTTELLAEPRNLLPAAYDRLREERYPLSLPFDLWLEISRRFLEHFETPLARVLEVFRPDEALFAAPGGSPHAYGWADVFIESLGISPAERDVLADPRPLERWFELYGYSGEPEAMAALASARAIARRLGVSYRELAAVVRTGFVNPALEALVLPRKLGVGVDEVLRYHGASVWPPLSAAERAAFEARLAAAAAAFHEADPAFDAAAALARAWSSGTFGDVLVLSAPAAAGCDFGRTVLRHADGTTAGPFDMVRLNFFVRLWKKLGWGLEETDRALAVFVPPGARTAERLGPALHAALVGLAHLKTLAERVNAGEDGRAGLLTLWSGLSTTGKNAPYARLFLAPGVLKQDPIFDHPLGKYLCWFDATTGEHHPFRWERDRVEDRAAGWVPLRAHLPAVQGALGLSADDVGAILAHSRQPLDEAPLSLDTLSLLYRHGLLARALGLSVPDLVALAELSGIDPFEFRPLAVSPGTPLHDDHPYSRTLRFVEVVEAVRASGIGEPELDFLLRHREPPGGGAASAPDPAPGLARTLAAELRRINTEHAALAGPATPGRDPLRETLAQALPPDVVESFLRLWEGSVEYAAVRKDVDRLPPESLAGEPAVRLEYHEVRREQRLVYRGLLVDADRSRLLAKVPAEWAGLLAALLDDARSQARAFFDRYLGRTAGGFLDPGDLDALFGPPPRDPAEREAEDLARRQRLAEAFLPFLRRHLIRQFVTRTLAAELGADPALAGTLMADAKFLADPGHPGQPLLDAFLAAAIPAPADAGLLSGAEAALHAYVELPSAGAYRFFLHLSGSGASATLRIGNRSAPLLEGIAGENGTELTALAELEGGVAIPLSLELLGPVDGRAVLEVQGEGLSRGPLGRLTIYPAETMERVGRARTLLAKSLRLLAALGIGEAEARHLLSHRDDFGVDLSLLPTHLPADEVAAATRATALFAAFLSLAGYARLKRELGVEGDALTRVFAHARGVRPAPVPGAEPPEEFPKDLFGRIGRLLRIDAAEVEVAVGHLHLLSPVETPPLAQERGLGRLRDALEVARRLGVPVEVAARWATPNPDAGTARGLRDTVKARHRPEAWRGVAHPIFDGLRRRQRDALVAHVMHRCGFDRVEQLFEFFLLDPGMEPVVQTSRLRLAISSVQLFVQRCLLNLEPEVPPSAIDAKQWEWMKRYRVWEANRKVFLFPENWLEPELRDDRTHLFRELESALLQGDVTGELAETAFFRYLEGLDQIARLEVVSAYLDEKADPAASVLHVIGRTHLGPRRYFHRRYARGAWTPWEPVGAEIEGDHLAALVWRDRLHLFWVTFLEKADEDANARVSLREMAERPAGELRPHRIVEAQLNWSEYFQGEWTPRASSGFGVVNVTVANDYDPSAVSVHASKEYADGREGAALVHVHFPRARIFPFSVMIYLSKGVVASLPIVTWGAVNPAFRVAGRNARPQVTAVEVEPNPPYGAGTVHATLRRHSGPLQVTFAEEVRTEEDGTRRSTVVTQQILRTGDSYSLLISGAAGETRALLLPFFYQDGEHTFFVEPSLAETTVQDTEEYAVPLPRRDVAADWNWQNLAIAAAVPLFKVPLLVQTPAVVDRITGPSTVVDFGGRLINQLGGLVTGALAGIGKPNVVGGTRADLANIRGFDAGSISR